MKNKLFTIYKHTNIRNGKSYIGKTSSKLEQHWRYGKGYINQPKFYNAIIKYGWDGFTHEILDIVDNIDIANELENKYIKQFNSISNGYNSICGEESTLGRKVLQLDDNLNILNEFSSISSASINLGLVISSISNCCNFKRKSTGGYHFCFKDEYDECVKRFNIEKSIKEEKKKTKNLLDDYAKSSENTVDDSNIIIREQEKKEKKVIGTQVSLGTYDKIKELAHSEYMSMSDFLRKIIILYLREVDKGNNC